MKRFKDLNDLISNCGTAKDFFNSLPDYVQSSICQRSGNVCSEEELRNYADNLLKGDG